MRRTRSKRLLLIGGLGVIAYAVLVAFLLLDAGRSARDGLNELRQARRDLTVADLTGGGGEDKLRQAADAFDHANDRLSSPLLAPVRLLPFVGRQIRSGAALSGAADDAVVLGADVLHELRAIIASGLPPGQVRVDALRESARIARSGRQMLESLNLGPNDGLVGPLGRARDRMAEGLDELERAMSDAADGAGSMADVLEGPTTWLMLAANNAEMRSGSGMFLSAATLHFDKGRMTLSDVRPLADMVLPEPVPVSDVDLAARWGWTGLDRDFRNIAFSPRFPATAEQASRMWLAATGERVDGVVALDVAGVAHFLKAIGAVVVDDRTIDSDSAVRFLLHDQYADSDPASGERRERLGRVAKALFDRIDQPGVDIPAVAQSVRDATQGRHLMVWSSDPTLQAVWERVDVAGALRADSLVVAADNRGGNKLDQYVDITARLDTSVTSAGSDVTVDLQLTNRAEAGDPRYVLGADSGTYDGYLTVNLPRQATNVSLDGTGQMAAAGSDGATSQVISRAVSVAPGGSVTMRLRFRVPPSVATLRVEPSARLPAIEWHWGASTWTDDELAIVTLGQQGKVDKPDVPY